MRARLFVMMSSSAGVVWVVKYGGHDPPCPRRVGALLSWCADSKKAPTKPGASVANKENPTRPDTAWVGQLRCALTAAPSIEYSELSPRDARSRPGSLGP
jgi:hypothetical protein